MSGNLSCIAPSHVACHGTLLPVVCWISCLGSSRSCLLDNSSLPILPPTNSWRLQVHHFTYAWSGVDHYFSLTPPPHLGGPCWHSVHHRAIPALATVLLRTTCTPPPLHTTFYTAMALACLPSCNTFSMGPRYIPHVASCLWMVGYTLLRAHPCLTPSVCCWTCTLPSCHCCLVTAALCLGQAGTGTKLRWLTGKHLHATPLGDIEQITHYLSRPSLWRTA